MPIIARSTPHGSPCDKCQKPGDVCWVWLDGVAMKTVCGKCAKKIASPAEYADLQEMDKLMRREMRRGNVPAGKVEPE